MVRRARLLILFLVLFAPLSAQKKYLVTPDREIIPLKPGDDVRSMIAASLPPAGSDPSDYCGVSYGYPAWIYWNNVIFKARHNEVIAQWFVTPVAGTIDTVFWENAEIGDALLDSTAMLRIHRSAIGPDYGPGVRPGPFNPPCQPWGYWINTNDSEAGIAAFPESATDTTWISTYPSTSTPTRPPIGDELWGFGGYPVRLRANAINFVAMDEISTLEVDAGERLFISIGLPPDSSHDPIPPEGIDEIPTGFWASDLEDDMGFPYRAEYPSRDWKFYTQTGTGWPSNCSTYDPDTLPPGWYARGGLTPDSTSVLAFNLWYTMTVTGNAPPTVWGERINNTFSPADQSVQATIVDCYATNPAAPEVASASIRYTVDGIEKNPVPMTYLGADVWQGSIPGQPAGSSVSYMILGIDAEGDTGNGPTISYRVVGFGNEWYALDTGYVCSPHDISATGTVLDPSGFFLPPAAPAGASAGNDGTSGPVDMGGDYHVFGDWFRYAWIGVNGGFALTKSPVDTQDVNSGGIWQTEPRYRWDFPNPQKSGRPDAVNSLGMPGMFIAPFWADFFLADSNATYGRIVTGNDGDSCLFIVEWDTLRNNRPGGYESTFRALLNRCAGTVEFQYPGAAWYYATSELSGMQADSNASSGPTPGYILLSRDGYPSETAPLDGRCIRMVPTVGFVAIEGWNLVAVSAAPLDGDYHQSSLFPDAGRTWRYQLDGYASPYDPIMSPGEGYWLKVPNNGRVGKKAGTFISELIVPVQNKWNMVGGPSGFFYVGDIIPIPAGPPYSLSEFFGYGEEGYYPTLFLEPGKAYWVNTGIGQFNSLWMKSSAAVPKTIGVSASLPGLSAVNSILLRDARGRSQTLYLAVDGPSGAEPRAIDMPPPPPGGAFDARFTTGRMLETFPASADNNSDYDFPVVIRDAHYPVTLTWNFPDSPGGRRWLLRAPIHAPGSGQLIEGSGSTVIHDPSTGTIVLTLSANSDLPAAYALNRNFPNPFNPTTTFTIDLPEPANVRVDVVDILGRSVTTLLDESKPAGTHALSWDSRDRAGLQAPTGVYIVRMRTGDFSATMKILFMK